MEAEGKVKSLHKALKVLECFTPKARELGVSEIARLLDLNKSNVYNILATLEECGYVKKNKTSEKYSLDFKMVQFSYTVMSSYPYTNLIVPVIKDLASDLNAIVYFGIPHGDKVLYLFSAYPKSYGKNIPYRSILGETAPYYCTSLGKALLISMEENEIMHLISGEKIKYTENTLVETEDILADIKQSKERGYAIDNIEHEIGVRCVGVPVTDRNGSLIGAISASGPTSIVTEEKIESFSQKIMTAAFEIQSRL
ncbi:IclR family transcriptional regulator [Treponema sp. UBA3813]|uniref:IclR family transcriptional regulator n=1 Tax=Treponema sp. UBA3813 TaxID=1947715 RepID=UPI0025E4522F|nr:IclR family transcriptional regulator [Treponema sp. UBA3813]